jgi:MoxR-like ATPase
MADPRGLGCKSCPSFVSEEDTVGVFKRSTGSPMCIKFGRVLTRPNTTEESQEETLKVIGSRCPELGNPRPVAPPQPATSWRLQVVLPDPDVRVSVPDDRVDTCVMCRNFVKEEVVGEELGWTAGLCAAKGKLVPAILMVREASGCEYRNLGSPRETTMGLHLFPEYDMSLGHISTAAASGLARGEFIEPTEYPTDMPLSEADVESGIRAWRRVVDPEDPTGERQVQLPIYDGDFFAPEERVKIPKTGSDEHPELYVDHNGAVYKVAVLWTALDETPAMWGEAGTGKTEFLRHMAWLMQLPFERISITAQTELDDLAGKFHYSKEKGTFFEYGRIPKAWTKPSVICLDEPNVGPPDVWQFLRPLTDNSKQLVLDQNAGELLSRHTDAYLGLAMNPAWDAKNVGAQTIGDADGSRLVHIFMELPPPNLEREIIAARVHIDGWDLSAKQLDMVMRVSGDIRKLCKEDTIPVSWGVRQQIKVARLLRWFDPITAYRMASADYLEPEAQQAMLDAVRANIEQVH